MDGKDESNDLPSWSQKLMVKALETIRGLRRPLPPGYKFDQAEVYERSTQYTSPET